MNFLAALDYLYALGHETLAMKFGLQNTQALLAAFDHPQQSFLKIQIAGTNGKGSVCAFLETIGRAANLKTGLFTSPHLVSITERIKIDGREISPAEFAELVSQVRVAAEHLIKIGKLETVPTFFEHLTIVALLAFRRAKIDVAILETGLGGRLDSTTAARAEIVGLTAISLDHQEYLGNTLQEIATEKAAIIDSNVRLAATAAQTPSVARVVRGRCRQFGLTPLAAASVTKIKRIEELTKFEVSFKTQTEIYPSVNLNLSGRHQTENAALAITLAEGLNNFNLKITPAAIISGLETARHPGRLEFWNVASHRILFDGAHNIAGAKALHDFFDEFYQNASLTIIFAAMRDKDLPEIAAELFPLAAKLILTRADNPRSAVPEDLKRFAPKPENTYIASSVAVAMQMAQQITPVNSLICVTGSLYQIGEAQKILLTQNPANVSKS